MSVKDDWTAKLTAVPKALLANRWILVLLGVLAGLEFYNSAVIPVLVNREKAVETSAIAANAKLRKQAEAAVADEKSLTAAAIAANAPKKQAADARKVKATAIKTAAEADTAAAVAGNSDPKTRAEAASQQSLANIAGQQAIVQKEISRQIARKLIAETEMKQIDVALSKLGLLMGQLKLKICVDCDPTYCVLCGQRRYIPDLPSGAELPPPIEGEIRPPPPVEPVITRFTGSVPWDKGSSCDGLFQTWKASTPYGAFTAGCEFSAGQDDLETAKRKAIAACRGTFSRDCQILFQMTPAAPRIASPAANSVLSKVRSGSVEIGGSCHDRFEEWKVKSANGAFAVGSQRCGYASGADTIEHARKQALETCSDRDCEIVYQIAVAGAPTTTGTLPQRAAQATVVAEQLNLHSAPESGAASVIGKLAKGQHIDITGPGDGDFIAIEATCMDGKRCSGFVNGRAEFIAR